MTQKDKKSEYLSSLKSIETENFLDRIFYRPVGYKIAKALQLFCKLHWLKFPRLPRHAQLTAGDVHIDLRAH